MSKIMELAHDKSAIMMDVHLESLVPESVKAGLVFVLGSRLRKQCQVVNLPMLM